MALLLLALKNVRRHGELELIQNRPVGRELTKMWPQVDKIETEAVELLGDFHPLLDQLGSADGLVTLAGVADSLQIGDVRDAEGLRIFLRDYHRRILWPCELPAIRSAFFHASNNELRELVELDGRIAEEPILRNFSGASRRVGQGQLQKLRPLKDQRFVQRYLAEVDGGRAHGWHTLIYGITLSVYSVPLRQGLFGYARQTTRGFIDAAAGSLRLTRNEKLAMFDDLCTGLALGIETLLTPGLAA
jgi:urease accessory protein UreF